MDNRINDKDLEFVNGGIGATANLQAALDQLRMALSLFTDDMPESARFSIAYAADKIDSGSTDMFNSKQEINTAINELKSFMDTLAGNPDKLCMVRQILYRLDAALRFLN